MYTVNKYNRNSYVTKSNQVIGQASFVLIQIITLFREKVLEIDKSD